MHADRALAEELLAMEGASFEDLLRRYWGRQGGAAPMLTERFVRGDLIGEARAAEVADQIEELAGRGIAPDMTILEVGCGTAALATVLARRAGHVVATDISLAWLVLARHRLRAAGQDNVTLVATSADRLPFDQASFACVVAADVIEHVPDPLPFASACFRVLRPGGSFWLSTPNRLSLTPEPHVRVWGVGWLPRSWGRRLVHRVRGVRYDDIHTLSLFELRRTLRTTGGRIRIAAPRIPRAVREGYSTPARKMIDGYELARRLPVVRSMLLGVTPLFHAIVEKA